MYKININETPLILCPKDEAPPEIPGEIRLPYQGKPKFLLNTIDMMEKSSRFSRVIITHTFGEPLYSHFHTLFHQIEAAGGLVKEPGGNILAIFRRGFWDLPKGKIDGGESPDEAALREVEEETGISGLVQGPLICLTHHTYREKKKRCLKHTWWYAMTVTNPGILVPQTEEDIEQAVWMHPDQFLDPRREVYQSLLEVVRRGCKS